MNTPKLAKPPRAPKGVRPEYFAAGSVRRLIALAPSVRQEVWWDAAIRHTRVVCEPPPASEGEGLLNAVRANPADRVTPLILADWWDENGRPDQAQILRAGLRHAINTSWRYVTPALVATSPNVEYGREWSPDAVWTRMRECLAVLPEKCQAEPFGRGEGAVVYSLRVGNVTKRVMRSREHFKHLEAELPQPSDAAPLLALMEGGSH